MTSKSLSNSFQGLKLMENTDLSVNTLLQKYLTEIMETLVPENYYKIVQSIFGAAYAAPNDAAYAAPNKGTTILY